MWKPLLASLLVATAGLAQDNPTAYDALRWSGPVNREMIGRIISVREWTAIRNRGPGDSPRKPERPAVCAKSGGSDNRVAADRRPYGNVVGSTEGATINTARLNLDSSGAYTVASYTAEKSHAPFTPVNYTLRTDERGEPVWIVTLHNRSRRPVGTIHIRANRGRVTRTEGMFQGRHGADRGDGG